MKITVIICTRNGATRLPDIFDDLARLEIAPGMTWEVLVVDNDSKDKTPLVIEREITRGRLPVVHLQQPMQGKSCALKKARGNLLIFTDDEVSPASGWLRAFYEAYQTYPYIFGFAEKVLPL